MRMTFFVFFFKPTLNVCSYHKAGQLELGALHNMTLSDCFCVDGKLNVQIPAPLFLGYTFLEQMKLQHAQNKEKTN